MIAATRALVAIPQRRSPRNEADEAVVAEQANKSRELVVIVPVGPQADMPHLSQRPAAPFLAQLIATEKKFPQTRARNRAEPGEAVAAYGAVRRMIVHPAA
ncbi:MAG TPA: hypothetical protein VM867_04680 [Xanthobacteraceae bacterium]|nr:hypothetical protein [Xanthobacteraceae bacterium]